LSGGSLEPELAKVKAEIVDFAADMDELILYAHHVMPVASQCAHSTRIL